MRLILGALLATLALNLSAADGQWIEDFDAAKKLAAKEQRLILLDFTGSDWCQPCKMLHQRYYDTTEFKSFAKQNLVLVLVDFPFNKEQSAKQKAANQKLAKTFKVRGYPTTVVLDQSGKELYQEVGLPDLDLAGVIQRLASLKDGKTKMP
ncbi:MAG: protein disulfide-isomerase [Yoonia sp.]|jgi:protein disulfide-isomerase